MTRKDVAEVFAFWRINWTNSSFFQCSAEALNAKIALYAECLENVDYWLGQKGAKVSVKTRKFPPTVAEYLDDIDAAEKPIKQTAELWYDMLQNELLLGGTQEEIYKRLLPPLKETIDELGGMERIYEPGCPLMNRPGIMAACYRVKKRHDMEAKKISASERKRLA